MDIATSAPLTISRREAARQLGVSQRTIDRLRKRGTLHTVRFSGCRRVLIANAELDRLVGGEGEH